MFFNKKAQAMTYDFLTALSIFLLIATLVASYWYYSSVKTQETIEKNHAANLLFSASDIWFKEGYPEYWNATNVKEIGLSNGNRINRTKMEMLFQLGYPRFTILLSLGYYNIQITVYNTSNHIIFQFPTIADFSSAKNIYRIERIGILDDQVVRISTILWD